MLKSHLYFTMGFSKVEKCGMGRIYQAITKWSHLFVYIIIAEQFRLFIAVLRAIILQWEKMYLGGGGGGGGAQ